MTTVARPEDQGRAPIPAPSLEQLSLNDRGGGGWEKLPPELRSQVWDSLKGSTDGCKELRRLCKQPVDKQHAAWCRENAAYLRECDLLKIRIDARMLVASNVARYGYIEDPERTQRQVDRDRANAARLAADPDYRGTLSISTDPYRAMNAELFTHDQCSLLGLKPIFGRDYDFLHAHWTTSEFAPGWKIWRRHFMEDQPGYNAWGLGSLGSPVSKWMLYAQKL